MTTKKPKSIVSLSNFETGKVQEIWTQIQKKIQVDVPHQVSRTRIKVRLFELFKDEIEEVQNVY